MTEQFVVVDLLWTPEGKDRRVEVRGPFTERAKADQEARKHWSRASQQRTVALLLPPWSAKKMDDEGTDNA